ncbi:MAG: threonine--tRNA ligase [Alphaproteobacteria bacterium]|nr:threonine--tRNA ligase [Alphaproteobacteria bacterium]
MEAQHQNTDQITITLPDGARRTYNAGVTGLEIAQSIAPSLAKAAIAVRVNDQQRDLSDPINEDSSLSIIKTDSDEGLEIMRHTVAAQILARAVKNLYPNAKLAIGPTIENGFYYDIEFKDPLSTDDLEKIEAEMRRIKETGASILKSLNTKADTLKAFEERAEPYKMDIVQRAEQNDNFQLYTQGGSIEEGGFIDLCRGPHLPSLKHVGAFKLLKVAGAYWRGDSSNQMLTRIYGTAWRTDKELENYLHQLEEAEKRDHRKLGAEMDLYHFQPEAQGSVFWHPKGFTIYNQMEAYIRRRLNNSGYREVKTPQLIDNKLWEASGHWGKYRENMFVVPDEIPSTDEDGPVVSDKAFEKLMALKPMNCPAHVQIFNQGIKSYRDLPIRMAEFGCCHRNEAHGALHGLMRVRQMTQDDAHIFCTESQITSESVAFCDLVKKVYADLGFNDVRVVLALRPEARAGSDEIWDKAENGLRQALIEAGLEFTEAEGEGAFYGPKIEYHIRDAIGRSWQCGTLQLDFVLPERLDASYIGEDGDRHRPVMLHRAILGSLERFIGIMIENTSGRLPLWLSPVQCVVATITGKADPYAGEVCNALKAAGIRAELDIRNEKINYKVREHSHAKVPVLFVVGAREAEEKTVAIRRLGSQDQNVESLEKAIESLANECKPPY